MVGRPALEGGRWGVSAPPTPQGRPAHHISGSPIYLGYVYHWIYFPHYYVPDPRFFFKPCFKQKPVMLMNREFDLHELSLAIIIFESRNQGLEDLDR